VTFLLHLCLQTIGVVLNDTSWNPMVLHLGNGSSGTYAFERVAPRTQGCLTYYFEVTTVTGEGTHRARWRESHGKRHSFSMELDMCPI
jgi:hypothetical protein